MVRELFRTVIISQRTDHSIGGKRKRSDLVTCGVIRGVRQHPARRPKYHYET
jgi:hypothetical protein